MINQLDQSLYLIKLPHAVIFPIIRSSRKGQSTFSSYIIYGGIFLISSTPSFWSHAETSFINISEGYHVPQLLELAFTDQGYNIVTPVPTL